MPYQSLFTSIFKKEINEKYWVLGLLALFFISLVFSFGCLKILYGAMLERSNRLPDIGNVQKESRLNIVSDFIDEKFNAHEKYIVVLGASQFYGFDLIEEDTFPYALDSYYKNRKVINLAFAGGMAKDALRILKLLKLKNIKLDHIIYNINIVHYNNEEDEGFARLPAVKSDKDILLSSVKMLKKYWGDYLFAELFGRKANRRLILDRRLIFRAGGVRNSLKPRHNVKYLLQLIDFIKNNSSDHLFILSPFCEKFLTVAGKNLDYYIKEAEYFEKIVIQNEGNIKNLTFKFNELNFIDSVHFNRNGHQKMADLIKRIIMFPRK